MSFRLCIFVCACRIVSALVVAPQQATQTQDDVERTLARTCGGQCLALLHTKSALLGLEGAVNASKHGLLEAIAGDVGHALKRATSLVAAEADAAATSGDEGDDGSEYDSSTWGDSDADGADADEEEAPLHSTTSERLRLGDGL